MKASNASDVVVIGGGVIGLSVAYQLACDGLTVTLLERGEPGREASWAGAGILPPASWYVDHPALDAMALAAADQQAVWSERLLSDSGFDDEYTVCGARYVATDENADYLSAAARRWRRLGVQLEADGSVGFTAPTEAQVRNPRRLQALAAACVVRGVTIVRHAEAKRFETDAVGRVIAAWANGVRHTAESYCLAAGCWTPGLAEPVAESLGAANSGRPVRGQMLLFASGGEALDGIVHRYPYYAVPRRDGRVLVGATVEEAGFDNRTTDAARLELLEAVEAMAPGLTRSTLERQWAGLRPASADELPLIGRLPEHENVWIATGHHRSGLQLAPPTAELISAMIRGAACDLPTEAFDPARFARRSPVVMSP